MRIGFVTQWFPPEPGTMVASAVAQGLSERGHDVHVLTGFPNYPSGVIQDGYPLRPYRYERCERGNVHRAPLYPSHDRSAFRRVANYGSFAAAATAVGWAKVPRPDAWLVYSSPATAALPALLSRWGRSVPVHLIMQDLWPDSVSQSGFVGGPLRDGVEAVLNRFCSWTYRRAAGIGVISPSMRHILVRRGVPDGKIHDTPNWVSPPDRVASGSGPGRAELGLPRGRLFMYAGNLGEMQGLDPLIRAFTQAPDAQLVVLGDGVARQRLQSMAEAAGATNIVFRGHVPSDRVGAFIRASDVQIVSLQDTPLLRATMPSKMQSALAHAKPVLAHAAGDVATLVRENHVGVVAPPGDRDATLAAIGALVGADEEKLSQMGASAGWLFDERFSPDVGLDRIEAMLATASGHGRTK